VGHDLPSRGTGGIRGDSARERAGAADRLAHQREEFPLVADQGKESLNFQISMTIYGVICIPLMFVVIGFLLGLALLIADVVFIIIAAMKANEGALYRYPLTIRLIK